MEKATFAGGCFWCIEETFASLKGVTEVIPGYAGGSEVNPSYEQVCSGTTSHREAVQVTFNRNIITYEELLRIFWLQIDPTDSSGQFADKGLQYKTAIFYHSQKQKVLAEKSKREISKKFLKPIVTEILPFTTFYPAEEYHKKYYKKNPVRYKMYKMFSGRERYLKNIWKP